MQLFSGKKEVRRDKVFFLEEQAQKNKTRNKKERDKKIKCCKF